MSGIDDRQKVEEAYGEFVRDPRRGLNYAALIPDLRPRSFTLGTIPASHLISNSLRNLTVFFELGSNSPALSLEQAGYVATLPSIEEAVRALVDFILGHGTIQTSPASERLTQLWAQLTELNSPPSAEPPRTAAPVILPESLLEQPVDVSPRPAESVPRAVSPLIPATRLEAAQAVLAQIFYEVGGDDGAAVGLVTLAQELLCVGTFHSRVVRSQLLRAILIPLSSLYFLHDEWLLDPVVTDADFSPEDGDGLFDGAAEVYAAHIEESVAGLGITETECDAALDELCAVLGRSAPGDIALTDFFESPESSRLLPALFGHDFDALTAALEAWGIPLSSVPGCRIMELVRLRLALDTLDEGEESGLSPRDEMLTLEAIADMRRQSYSLSERAEAALSEAQTALSAAGIAESIPSDAITLAELGTADRMRQQRFLDLWRLYMVLQPLSIAARRFAALVQGVVRLLFPAADYFAVAALTQRILARSSYRLPKTIEEHGALKTAVEGARLCVDGVAVCELGLFLEHSLLSSHPQLQQRLAEHPVASVSHMPMVLALVGYMASSVVGSRYPRALQGFICSSLAQGADSLIQRSRVLGAKFVKRFRKGMQCLGIVADVVSESRLMQNSSPFCSDFCASLERIRDQLECQDLEALLACTQTVSDLLEHAPLIPQAGDMERSRVFRGHSGYAPQGEGAEYPQLEELRAIEHFWHVTPARLTQLVQNALQHPDVTPSMVLVRSLVQLRPLVDSTREFARAFGCVPVCAGGFFERKGGFIDMAKLKLVRRALMDTGVSMAAFVPVAPGALPSGPASWLTIFACVPAAYSTSLTQIGVQLESLLLSVFSIREKNLS